MAEDPLHRIVCPASTTSDATTIFNASVEPRFFELRATVLSNRRECSAAATPAAVSVGDFVFATDLDEKRNNTDIERVIFALNLNNWICGAHAVLDPNNYYDREMLSNIASYVDKRRQRFAENLFFQPLDKERRSECILMSREEIL